MVLKQLATLRGHVGVVWSVVWSPNNGENLASCGEDRSVVVWRPVESASNGEWLAAVKCSGAFFPRTLRSLCWGPLRQNFAVGGFDGLVTLLEVGERRAAAGTEGGEMEMRLDAKGSLEGHENEVKCVAFSPSGSMLASCARDKTVWLWEDGMDDGDFECAGLLPGHSADVKHIAWHPQRDDVIVSSSYDNTIRVWQEDIDAEEFLTVAVLSGHGSTVWATSFNQRGTRLASVSDDKSLIIWSNNASRPSAGQSSSKWAAVCTIANAHSRPIYTVDWSTVEADRGGIATGGGDNSIRVYQRREGKESGGEGNGTGDGVADEEYTLRAEQRRAHAGDVNCVRWHPSRPELLASAGDDGLVKVWTWVDV